MPRKTETPSAPAPKPAISIERLLTVNSSRETGWDDDRVHATVPAGLLRAIVELLDGVSSDEEVNLTFLDPGVEE